MAGCEMEGIVAWAKKAEDGVSGDQAGKAEARHETWLLLKSMLVYS